MDQAIRNYEGIEIGAVSVKWARLSSEEMVAFEVIRAFGRGRPPPEGFFSSQRSHTFSIRPLVQRNKTTKTTNKMVYSLT